MSFNGSGSFSINSTGQPVVEDTLITAAVMNALTADLATGLSTAICKDGQTTVTANIPMGGFKFTGLAAGSARTDSAAIANLQDGTGVYVATVGGTANAITLTPSPAITAYVAGQTFRFLVATTNTSTVTVAISGLATKAITKQGTTALSIGDLVAGELAQITYDGTEFVLAVPNLNGVVVTAENPVINGAFTIWQQGTSFTAATTQVNNDDAYLADQWYLLSDGNDVVDVTQETGVVPTNGLSAIRLDVETINLKFGLAQIIEQKNCQGYIGETCTLSFKAKVSSTVKLDNIKAAIVAWSGTADVVTSDIISAWGIEGTNPTLIANAAYENAPANLGVTTSYATYAVTAPIDTASAKNIILLIWSDVTDTTLGDFLYITEVQLDRGGGATPFRHRPVQAEQTLSERYYQKTYQAADAPGTSVSAGQCSGTASSSTELHGGGAVRFPVRMRTAPTVKIRNPTNGTLAEIRDATAAVNRVPSVVDIADHSYRMTSSAMTISNLHTWHHELDARL